MSINARAGWRIWLLSAALLQGTALAADVDPPATPTLTLEECIQQALAAQPKLRQVQSDLEAAQARLRQAWSTVIPHLNATANDTYADVSGGSSSAVSGGTASDGQSGSASITAKQVLWDFGRSVHRVQQGRADIEAARWQALSTRQTTTLTVTQAYLTALEAQGTVDVATQALKQAQEQLKRTHGFADVGLRSRADVLTAASASSQAAFARLQALDNVAFTQHILNEAIGRREDATYRLVEPTAWRDRAGEDLSLDTAISNAVAKRPELRHVAALEQSADAQMRATRDGWWPTLSASGGYTGRKTESADPTQTWSATVSATWDVWDGGLTAAQTAEARAQLNRKRAETQETTLAITREVQDAWLRVREFQQHMDVAQQMVAEADERLRLVQGRYAAGLSSMLDVTDALHNVVSAKQVLLAARTDAYLAHVQFRYATGEELQ